MYRILVLNSDTDGVGYYRLLTPHLTLNQDDKDIVADVRLLSDHTIPILDERFLSQYQAIIFNKVLPLKDDVKPYFLALLKKHNIKLIFDIDDYYILKSSHINYKQWKNSNAQQIVEVGFSIMPAPASSFDEEHWTLNQTLLESHL